MSKTSKISSTSTNLLLEGKSNRLMEMRKKAMAAELSKQIQHAAKTETVSQPNKTVEAELLQVRQLIDQRLTEILIHYPSNKKARFFAIRFGVSVDQLKKLPIKEIFAVLGIKQKSPVNMKQIADLDYNDRLTL